MHRPKRGSHRAAVLLRDHHRVRRDDGGDEPHLEAERVMRAGYNVGRFAGIIFTSRYAKNVDEPRVHE